eukprot:3273172-Rhodomonas_salina.1
MVAWGAYSLLIPPFLQGSRHERFRFGRISHRSSCTRPTPDNYNDLVRRAGEHTGNKRLPPPLNAQPRKGKGTSCS